MLSVYHPRTLHMIVTEMMKISNAILNLTLKIPFTRLHATYRLRTSIYFTVLYHIASRAANNSMRQFGN